MATRHKILLLDDDAEVLHTYEQLLGHLPSEPEVVTANSGSRAMALLESQTFRVLICDLKMPKMDGLQVLSIVRRKYPALRTVVLTSAMDEQYRSRSYALGIDLFWHKPTTEQEIKMFLECLESLLGRDMGGGFRGVQSKSLVDLIQLECISQSSSVLRITNGPFSGKIWIQDGEIVDAEAEGNQGEPAFHKILSWKAGAFESLPAEPTRSRTITKSYNGLLLETAQAIDESSAENGPTAHLNRDNSAIAQVSSFEGIEFVLALKPGDQSQPVSRGLENPEKISAWTRDTLRGFHDLGEQLHAGPLEEVEGLGPQRHVTLAAQGSTEFCFGWKYSMSLDQVRDMTKKVLLLWGS
jgi:CheY-like chemotaxis protein